MIYRPEAGKSESLSAYYERKQSVKHNGVAGEAERLHDKDRDAESANAKFSSESYKSRFGKDGGTILENDD